MQEMAQFDLFCFGRKITFLSKKELDVIRLKYGEIVNSSEISNGIDEIYDVWNQ